jgi:hypothetical protein
MNQHPGGGNAGWRGERGTPAERPGESRQVTGRA